MAAKKESGPPFPCPKLPSVELQTLISKCNVFTTNSFWLQYYLPQPIRIDSGINVRLPSALSIQNSSGHDNSSNNKKTNNNSSHARQQSTITTRQLESLKFEVCLAANLANKPNLNKPNDSNNTNNKDKKDDVIDNTNKKNEEYDDPFAGLSFESPKEDDKNKKQFCYLFIYLFIWYISFLFLQRNCLFLMFL